MNTSASITTGYAPVYMGSLYYEVAGSGLPLLFIHAGVADCSMWDDQVDYFSRNYKVIRYDARGYGRSHTETTQFSNRQDILDLFKHLGVEKAAVIGISRGGQIAIDFTIEYPEKVTALVAATPGISGYEYNPGDDPQAKREFELFNHMDELWDQKAWEALADLQVRVWADGASQPEGRADPKVRHYMREKILADLRRQDGEATPIPLNPPAINRLGEISQPTLIIVGEYDTRSALAVADELECRIPHNRKVGIPGVAHMIPMEKPEIFNPLVSEFLREEL